MLLSRLHRNQAQRSGERLRIEADEGHDSEGNCSSSLNVAQTGFIWVPVPPMLLIEVGHANLFLAFKADAENRPMYLESSSIANNAFYEKFGFKVKKEISFKRGRVPVKLDIMVREPQSRKVADSLPVFPLVKRFNKP